MTESAKKSSRTKAEADAYAKGYEAGRRRQKVVISREEIERERKAFAERVFLAVLPSTLLAQNWKFGDVPITTTEQRIELAVRWAKRATIARYEL